MLYTFLYPFLRYLLFYVKFNIFSLQNNNFKFVLGHLFKKLFELLKVK